jgi:tRNA pseudouridine38-40 synthase
MVGSLKLVGDGKWTAGDLKKAWEARKRTACGPVGPACGPVAPACGLYLGRVDY